MTRAGQRRGVLLLAAASWMAAPRANAGGAILYEVGTPDVGYASAGYASRADEPATVLTNPAGMTRLDGVQVQVGAQAVYANLTFSPNASTTVSGNNGGNAVGWLPGGGAFASFEVIKDLHLGFAAFSNFGLTESWQSGWVGRYYVTKSTLIGLSLMPAVSLHVIAGLSLGATLNVMYGHLEYQAAINNAPVSGNDGSLSMSSNTWGVGGDVGVLYELSEKTRLGATYTSPVGLNFSSTPVFRDVRITGLNSLKLDLGMTVPQTVMLSLYQGLGDQWAVMADVGWQNWAAFGTVEAQVTAIDPNNPHATTTHIGYLNTWHGALGGQVRLSDPWQVNFGIAYDSTMTNAQNRSLPLAIGDAWRFGAGAQWDVDKSWRVALAYELLWGGSPSVDVNRGPLTGRVSGTYADTWFQFFALGFTWKS
jgi:long-chain fatty acid transport protein